MSVPGPLSQGGDDRASQKFSTGHPDSESLHPAPQPARPAPHEAFDEQPSSPQVCEHFAEQLAADVWMNDSAVMVVGIWPANGDSWANAVPVRIEAAANRAANRATI